MTHNGTDWEALADHAKGEPLPVGCTGKSAHARRALGRFQRYEHPNGREYWAEVYSNGVTPPFDQHLVPDSAGRWVEVDQATQRAAIINGTPWRAKWSRECPKCGRHYVFDFENLHALIERMSATGVSWAELSTL
jgi:hypothetical protein